MPGTASLLPIFAFLLLVLGVLLGRQKTLPGELLVITAFTTLILPMAAASGVDPTRAALASAVWWLSFGLAALEVRAIKVRHRRRAASVPQPVDDLNCIPGQDCR